jgi:hypothetical protein
MAMALVDCGRGAAVLMLLAACTQRDSTDLEPIVRGGAAGAAGSWQELGCAGGADVSAGWLELAARWGWSSLMAVLRVFELSCKMRR